MQVSSTLAGALIETRVRQSNYLSTALLSRSQGSPQDAEGRPVMVSVRGTLSSFFVSSLTQAHTAAEDFKTN